MKDPAKLALIFIMALLLGGLAYYLFPVAALIYGMHTQMKAGQEYMDSLSDEDIKVWIERTSEYLKEYDPNSSIMQGYGFEKPMPGELKELRILNIVIFQDSVNYVWLGGMDHTYLEVRRTAEGDFEVIANYNDYSSRLIWPKQERTP